MDPEQEIIEQNLDKNKLQISDPVKIDIYQHMRTGIQNKEINCMCMNEPENMYYCIPCKSSCCNKCSLADHCKHLLLEKNKYELQPKQIDNSFGAITSVIHEDELFQNIEKYRNELLEEVDITCKKIVDMAEEWRIKKHREINGLIDEIKGNIKICEDRKKEVTKVINKFGDKHRDFFSLKKKNSDPHNTIFLISYDLLSITYLWSNNLANLGKEIEKDMLDYQIREQNKDQGICEKIREILFLSDDEDPFTHEKIDERFLPLIRLNMEIKEFNTDGLEGIEKRIAKFNKCIDVFKNSVLNSINKYGNYKE